MSWYCCRSAIVEKERERERANKAIGLDVVGRRVTRVVGCSDDDGEAIVVGL